MAQNKNLPKFAIFSFDDSLKKWIPFAVDIDVNGALIVSSYSANPIRNSVVVNTKLSDMADIYRNAALTNSAVNIKPASGSVNGWYLFNPNTTVNYVDIFNSLAANVNLGTTVPIFSLGLPANSGANFIIEPGLPFSTAISVAGVTTAGGSTAPTNNLVVNIFYK